MTQESQTDDTCGLSQAGGCPPIGIAGLWVTAWVIVGDGERPAVVPQDCVQNLTDWHKRAVSRTLGHDDGVTKLVSRIADEDEYALSPQAIKFLASDPGNIVDAAKHNGLVVKVRPLGELEGGNQRRGLS